MVTENRANHSLYFFAQKLLTRTQKKNIILLPRTQYDIYNKGVFYVF